MKKKVMNALENFSKAMLQPLMYLSVGGLILAIGALLTNSAISGALPFLKWAPIQILGNLMYQTIYVIVNNLAVLFVIGIPAAMAKKDKHHAGIIGLMSYPSYLTMLNFLLSVLVFAVFQQFIFGKLVKKHITQFLLGFIEGWSGHEFVSSLAK